MKRNRNLLVLKIGLFQKWKVFFGSLQIKFQNEVAIHLRQVMVLKYFEFSYAMINTMNPINHFFHTRFRCFRTTVDAIIATLQLFKEFDTFLRLPTFFTKFFLWVLKLQRANYFFNQKINNLLVKLDILPQVLHPPPRVPQDILSYPDFPPCRHNFRFRILKSLVSVRVRLKCFLIEQ